MFESNDHTVIDKSLWLQLLISYYQLFCNNTGGFYAISEKSMPHDEFVLAELSKAIHEMEIKPRETIDKPVTDYLQTALSNAQNSSKFDIRELANSIERLSSQLTWEYGYQVMPKDLYENYAYVEVLGSKGPILSNQLVLGLLLLSPDFRYPEHYHVDISESYICLSGKCEINNSLLNPGDYFYNSPNNIHYIASDSDSPSLLAYAWTGALNISNKNITKFSNKNK